MGHLACMVVKIRVYLRGVGQETLDCIFLAQVGQHRMAVVGKVTNGI